MDRRFTRTLALSLAVSAPIIAPGCQQAAKPPGQSPPLVIDEAMQKRDWQQSQVYIANGNVEAGPTRSRFTPETNDESYNSTTAGTYGEGFTQFLGGMANVLFLPISRIFTPSNASETSNGGMDIQPSYTGITPPAAPEPGTLGTQTNPPTPGQTNNSPPGAGPTPGTPPGADRPGIDAPSPGTNGGGGAGTGTGAGGTGAGGGAGSGVLDK